MKIKCECIVCGKIFFQHKSRINQGIKCCSNDCRGKRMQGKNNHNYKGGSINRWGYKMIWHNGKKVYEHRHIMERHLNRKLLPEEEVHHINGNKLDNNIENLQILTIEEHKKIHRNPINGQFTSRVLED